MGPRRPFRPPRLGSSGPPRGPTPRERAWPAAPKAPGRPFTRRRRAREGGRAPRRPRARPLENRGPLRVRPPPQHIPGSSPRGEVHARGPWEASASVTHQGEESPASGIAAQTQKARRPAPQLPPNSRSGVSEAAISEPPSLPSFKPLASGAARPREAPSPAPPRPGGRRDGRGGSRSGRAPLLRRAHYFSCRAWLGGSALRLPTGSSYRSETDVQEGRVTYHSPPGWLQSQASL